MMSGDLKGVGGVVVAAFLGGKEQLTGADVSGIRLNQRVVHYRLEFGRGRVDRKSTRLNSVTSRSRMPSSA
jgi:hypothetical protein